MKAVHIKEGYHFRVSGKRATKRAAPHGILTSHAVKFQRSLTGFAGPHDRFILLRRISINVEQEPEIEQKQGKQDEHIERIRQDQGAHELQTNDRKRDAFDCKADFVPPFLHTIHHLENCWPRNIGRLRGGSLFQNRLLNHMRKTFRQYMSGGKKRERGRWGNGRSGTTVVPAPFYEQPRTPGIRGIKG